MNKLEVIQSKLEVITAKWWFYLLLILIQFIYPYASKGYDWEETGEVVAAILGNAVVYSLNFYWIFKIIPIIFILLIVFLRNRVARLFSIYVGINYIIFAFGQSIANTERYGLGVVLSNLIMFLIVACFWFWEAIVNKNDFSPKQRKTAEYWLLPLAVLAFWFPLNFETLLPDFNITYFITNSAGLTFCMMTPVYLSILILFYPKINIVTLRVTSLIGLIIAFYNMWVNFGINAADLWWNGILHIPLLVISLYGFVLSLRKQRE